MVYLTEPKLKAAWRWLDAVPLEKPVFRFSGCSSFPRFGHSCFLVLPLIPNEYWRRKHNRKLETTSGSLCGEITWSRMPHAVLFERFLFPKTLVYFFSDKDRKKTKTKQTKKNLLRMENVRNLKSSRRMTFLCTCGCIGNCWVWVIESLRWVLEGWCEIGDIQLQQSYYILK